MQFTLSAIAFALIATTTLPILVGALVPPREFWTRQTRIAIARRDDATTSTSTQGLY